jgi:hypothetical protein
VHSVAEVQEWQRAEHAWQTPLLEKVPSGHSLSHLPFERE